MALNFETKDPRRYKYFFKSDKIYIMWNSPFMEKCTVLWVLTNVNSYVTIITVKTIYLHHLKFPPSFWQPCLLLLHFFLECCVLCSLLNLFSFTLHSALESHPYCCIHLSVIFVAEQYSIEWIYHICLSASRHLCYFWFLVILWTYFCAFIFSFICLLLLLLFWVYATIA